MKSDNLKIYVSGIGTGITMCVLVMHIVSLIGGIKWEPVKTETAITRLFK